MKKRVLFPLVVLSVVFAGASAFGAARLEGARLRGTTDKPALSYKTGEEIVFSLKIEGLKGAVPEGCTVRWERTGDDGVRTEGTAEVPVAEPLVVKTSLAKPGFVRLVARVVGADGADAVSGIPKAWDAVAPIAFEGGAGVEPEKLMSVPEPDDFDGFWNRRKAQLGQVPVVAERAECVSTNPAVKVYAVSVKCAGPRPVTGFLTVPADASTEKRYPAHLTFEGYGERIPVPPKNGPGGEIRFLVNAFGYE